jgi:superfamily II DNA or RNA helicase
MHYFYLCTLHGDHSKLGITTRPLGCRLAEYFTSDHTAAYFAAVRFDNITLDQLYAIEKKCLIATRDFFFTDEHRARHPNSEARYHKTSAEFWDMIIEYFPTPYVIVGSEEQEAIANDQADDVKQPPRHFQSARDFELIMTEEKMFDYQRECVTMALSWFAQGIDRFIINWACGLGKTFTTLNIAAHDPSRILIGVPSRLLLSQWFDVICSMPSLESRLIIVVGHKNMSKRRMSGYYKMSHPDVIRSMCNLYTDAIILTTYSSSYKVAAAMGDDELFGTAIFDECHHLCKTRDTQADEKAYSYILKIRAKHRVSLSATLKGSPIDLTGNFDRMVFGNVIDTKSTLWAIEHKRLTDYKLATINMSHADLDIAIELCKADHNNRELFLAGYSAVERIKNDPGLTHMLVYTNSIHSAKIVKAYIDKIVAHLLPGEEFYNNELSSENARDIDSETALFNNAPRGVISCVFIFGEGFDMPRLNGVLVAEEMVSEIRIVQSILRPHRLERGNPGKIAQIILPHIDDEKHSSFSKVRTVAAQLGSEDANLSQRLCVGTMTLKNSASGGFITPIVNFQSLAALENIRFLLWPRGITKDHYLHEYEVVQGCNRELGLKSMAEYVAKRAEHKHWINEPKKYFNERCIAWKNVYDFLGVDVSKFPKHKEEWRLKCKSLRLTSTEYDKKCATHDMPRWPDELYVNFGNLRSELDEDRPRRRR